MDFRIESAHVARIVLIGLAGLFAYLLIFASRLSIDYFDSYESFLNAKALLSTASSPVYHSRFYLFSTLLAPLFQIEKYLNNPLFGFTAAHVVVVLCSLACVFLFGKILNLYFGKCMAVCGAALFAMNPLMLQMAPMAKEDVPALAFMLGAVYSFLRYRIHRKTPYFIGTIGLTAACIGSRYNLLPIVVVLCMTAICIETRPLRYKAYQVLLWSAGLFLIGGIVYYTWIKHQGIAAGIASFYESVESMWLYKSSQKESASQNYGFMLRSVTWPLIGLFGLGVLSSVLRKRKEHIFYISWLVPCFILQTYLIGGKEARYLLPLLPPMYFFIIAGISECVARILVTKHSRIGLMVLFVSVIIMPAQATARCLMRYQDPVYKQGYEQKVSLFAAKLAGSHSIYWYGAPYAVYPKDYLFDSEDEFSYVYHFYLHTIKFFTGLDKVFLVADTNHQSEITFLNRGAFVLPQDALPPEEGDVLVVNRAGFLDSKTIPKTIIPLWIGRTRVFNFVLQKSGDGGVYEYGCDGNPGVLLHLQKRDDDAHIIVDSLLSAPANLYAEKEGGILAIAAVPTESPRDSRLRLVVKGGFQIIPNKLKIVTYDHINEFSFR
jgi:hypothetical protein